MSVEQHIAETMTLEDAASVVANARGDTIEDARAAVLAAVRAGELAGFQRQGVPYVSPKGVRHGQDGDN